MMITINKMSRPTDVQKKDCGRDLLLEVFSSYYDEISGNIGVVIHTTNSV